MAKHASRMATFQVLAKSLAPVVQRVDNAIHWINRYPVDKCQQNELRYQLDSDLSGG